VNPETKMKVKIRDVTLVISGVIGFICLAFACVGIVVTPDVVIPDSEPTTTIVPSSTMVFVPTQVSTPKPTETPIVVRTEARVTSVIDGDTIKVEINKAIYTVRYVGIDTPETVHPSKPVEWMGMEASEANKRLVEGQMVYLEKDVTETDQYGRLLRYVFLADGLFVNAELVRLGYAQVSTYPPNVRYQDLFLEMEREARENERGLWGPMLTATSVPSTPTPESTCDCSGNLYNCKDFSTHNQAQACYDYCAAQGYGDIHKLDRDNDGVACESLP